MTEWKRTLVGIPEIMDQYEDDPSTIPAITRQIIDLLKKDVAYPNDRELVSVIEEFEVFEGEEDMPYFDLIMHSLYDWADRVKVWIEPLPVRR